MDNKEFFNKVASEWDNMCNHAENKIRKIIDLSSVKSNSKILDVGTGTGILIKYLIEKNPTKITAVDISENMIKIAKDKYKNNIVEFVAKDIIEFYETGFDYIFIYSAYPHFDDKEVLFKHLSERLNPNGKIIIAHSESKEKINAIHSKNNVVKDDVLPAAKITIEIMSKYYNVNNSIDDNEMYYISGIKK